MTTNPKAANSKVIIYLGADHGGFAFKEEIKGWLDEWGTAYEDCGALSFDSEDDYPDYALAVAEKVAEVQKLGQSQALGVLICRSGGGMTIAANKVDGIRAVPVYEPKQAVHARHHDHANVISLAGDWMTPEQAKDTLRAFLDTPIGPEPRRFRRVALITAYEEQR